MFVSPKLSVINVPTAEIVHVGFFCVLENMTYFASPASICETARHHHFCRAVPGVTQCAFPKCFPPLCSL